MVLSTIYDSELRQKVFQIRDSERYTNSTQITLEYEYTNDYRSHMTLDLTANVFHHEGKSSVVFYDNEDVLGIVECKGTDSSVTLEDIDVPYGYHKLYAKYMGNTQCLSSKSGISELTVDEPDLPTPTITLTRMTDSEQASYDWNSSLSTIGMKVQFDGSNGKSGKTIKFYDNDELINTYTTGSGGVASIPAATRSVGVHNWKFVFEGDDTYLAAEAEDSFAVGFEMTATAETTSIASGNTVSFNVHAQVPDFDYQDGSDEGVEATIALKRGNTVEDYATFIGDETLTSSALSSSATFRIIEDESNNYIDIEITVIPVGTITLTTDNNIISTDISTILTATVKDTSNAVISGVPITIFTENHEDTFDGITDSNGQFSIEYEGSGSGIITFYTECGDTLGEEVEIYDTLQYLSQRNNINYNLDYYLTRLTCEFMYNGMQFVSNSTDMGYVTFVYPNSITEDWVFEMDITYVWKNSSLIQLCGATITYNQLKDKPHLKVIKINNQRKVFINDTLISTSSNAGTLIPYIDVDSNSRVKFDNIMLMRL